MPKRATIGDVAAAASVSVATVSRVLNGGVVKNATAQRVWQEVDRLEYAPNALTRSIFAGRSSTIGVVIRDLGSPFYLDLMKGIDEVAALNGSLVMFANTFRRDDREAAQVATMDEQRVRGLILTTGQAADAKSRRMAENGTPCVTVTRAVQNPPPGLHSVTLDNVGAGRLMAAHLTACGRSSVGVIASGARPSQLERTAGLREGLEAAGAALPAEMIEAVNSEHDVKDSVSTLLARARAMGSPLDAIVCHTGRFAVDVFAALATQDLAVPDDIAFLTMDDFPWAAPLGITVVSQPSYEMGRSAAELIVEKPEESTQITFEPTLIARTSCGEAT